MENNVLILLKTLADDTRLKIVRALYQKEMYVELLAERLDLSPATVSFHMKKLQQAGLVDARREQYYTIFSLKRDIFFRSLKELIFSDDGGETVELLREEQYRNKVLKSFMPHGVCEQLPAQLKKRMIIYREIFNRFDPTRSYSEKEVNEIISAVHSDYCTVRRGFVAMGWMDRSNGIYTVNADPDWERYPDING
jgi:biotin operon repressor